MGKIKQEKKKKKRGWDQQWISRENKKRKRRNKKKRGERERAEREEKKGFHLSLRSTEIELSVFVRARRKVDLRIASYA